VTVARLSRAMVLSERVRGTVTARSEIEHLFGPKARLTSLHVRSLSEGVEVDGLVATPTYIAKASAQIERGLRAAIGTPVRVSLDQVVLGDPERFAAEQTTAATAAPDPDAAPLQLLRDAVPFPTQALAYDPSGHRGVVLLRADSGIDLAAAMALENGLRSRDGLEQTIVIPPMGPLAPVRVTLPGRSPPTLGSTLATDAWALRRWNATSVTATFCDLVTKTAQGEAVATALDTALAPLTVKVIHGSWRDCRALAGAAPGALLTMP
jgi:hypothetical protein